jgi:hypothetical protein
VHEEEEHQPIVRIARRARAIRVSAPYRTSPRIPTSSLIAYWRRPASCSRGDNSCAFGVRPSICRRAREYHISLERRRGFRRHIGVHNRSGATQVSLRPNLRTLRG